MLSFAKKVVFVLAFVVALAGSIVARTHATEYFVDLIGISFVPQFLNVDVGDKVTWRNPVGSLFTHTTTSGPVCGSTDGWWDSGPLTAGQTFSYTFIAEGIYPYHCTPHCGLGMTGQIAATGPLPTENSTWGQIKELYRSGEGGR